MAAVEAGALQQLIRHMSVDTSVSFRSCLLAALSSLVRHFPFAQQKFLELGGLQTLSGLLTQRSVDGDKLSIKAVTLVSDLLTESVCIFFSAFVRSTSKSRPNNIRGGKNVRPSVRPSTKSFFDFNEIWYIGRGR